MLALCQGGGSPLWEQRHCADHPFPVLVLNSWYQEFRNIQMQVECAGSLGTERRSQHLQGLENHQVLWGSSTGHPKQPAGLEPLLLLHTLGCWELTAWVLSATGLFLILRSLWSWTPWELISAPEQSLLPSLSYQHGLQTGEGHPRHPELEQMMWIQALATPETSAVSYGIYFLEL